MQKKCFQVRKKQDDEQRRRKHTCVRTLFVICLPVVVQGTGNKQTSLKITGAENRDGTWFFLLLKNYERKKKSFDFEILNSFDFCLCELKAVKKKLEISSSFLTIKVISKLQP